MNRLETQVQDALRAGSPDERPAAFRHISKQQIKAIDNALADNRVSVELRLGPTTRIAPSTLTRLRTELMAAFNGVDVLEPKPIAVDRDFIDRAVETRFPSGDEQ